jgi:pyruvate dehydrogenase E1 component
LIGGIYYEIEEDGRSAHLEKIVVGEPHRRKGVADGLMNELFNRLRAAGDPEKSYVETCFEGREGPFVAATDYMAAVPDQIRQWVPGRYVTLGTDGYGRSDGRQALRRHFEVDRHHVVIATLKALADEGRFEHAEVARVIEAYGIDPDKPDPVDL